VFFSEAATPQDPEQCLGGSVTTAPIDFPPYPLFAFNIKCYSSAAHYYLLKETDGFPLEDGEKLKFFDE
jgi:hypothetical protein